MTKNPTAYSRLRRRLSRLFIWIPGLIVAMFLLGFSFLQIPKVQTYLINEVSFVLSENTGFDVSLDHVNLTWYNHMVLKGVRLFDHQTDSTLIKVDNIKVNFEIWHFLTTKHLKANELILEAPHIHIIKVNDSTEVNISRLLTDLKNIFKKNKEKKSSISVNKITIHNGTFSYDDMRRPTTTIGKDYNHFRYDSLETVIESFRFSKDSVGLKITSFQTKDRSDQLNINHLNGYFAFTKKQMWLYDFELKTDHSTLNDSLTFVYNQPSDLTYFMDSIEFYTQMHHAIISTNDLKLFAPKVQTLHDPIDFSGIIKGGFKRLKVKEFDIKIGNTTRLKGDIELYGIPKLEETFIMLSLKKSKIDPRDVEHLIPRKMLSSVLNIGKMEISGNYAGFSTDFVADGRLISNVGEIKTDINFKIHEDNRAWYDGKIKLTQFDLRAVFPQQTLERVSLIGKINGNGLTINNAQFTLDAEVDSLKIATYTYSNIKTNGRFQKGFFNGYISISDPNILFDGELEIDLRNNRNKVDMKAILSNANLQPLGLTQKNISIGSSIDINMKGLKTDDLIGYISLYDNQIFFEEKKLQIDSIKLLSSIIGSQRFVHFETDGLTGEMKGEFKNSILIKTMAMFYKEIKLHLGNDSKEIEQYYFDKKDMALEKYNVAIDLNLWDLNKFIQPFYKNFNFSKKVKFHGSFKQDSISRFRLYGEFDSLQFANYNFIGNNIDLHFSKYYYKKNILASSELSSKSHSLTNKYTTENVSTEMIWFNNKINLSTNLEQEKFQNKIQLNSTVEFLEDKISFKIEPSYMEILGKKWEWDTANHIYYEGNSWTFEDVAMRSDSEKMSIVGKYSDNPSDAVNITIKEFDLTNLRSIFTTKIDGVLDGRIKIKKRKKNNLIEGDIVARAFKIEDFLLGNIFGISEWQNKEKRLAVSLDLVRNGKKKIDVDGMIYPIESNEQLDLLAKFDSANLKIVAPLLKKLFSQVSGFASGEFGITGSLKAPILKGKGKVHAGHAKVDYLNTEYDFNGNIIFEENEVGFQNLVLFDSEKNQAILNGGIFHEGFKNMVIDIGADFENFKMLNTVSTDNNAYYGTAYGTGHISFVGSSDNIKIEADAQTTKGTRISIPIGDLTGYKVDKKEYINFVDLTQDKYQIENTTALDTANTKIKGIQLDFDIEFTPDAYVELIFDLQSGDIIRGRGNGNIELTINNNGDFNMFGDFEIEKGGYNFTLYNIINKEFVIQKGSRISWFGDPYRAQLNILAEYRQLVSLAPILEGYLGPEDEMPTEARRKYPTIVELNLQGALLSPEIKFDIITKDYPQNMELIEGISFESVLRAFQVKIQDNEQEMNRQVFSLIILKKFSPENSFQVNTKTIGNSISEFVSNQLSYWATQVDENLEIDVDLAGLDTDAFNTFQLRLSYTFMDGRLRVTRGGGLPNEQTKANVSEIIGDWTVEYLLTEDGRFRVKMYSRSDVNVIEQQLGESNIETGFSLQYVKSFDHLKQILKDNRKKSISKQSKENAEDTGS